jgi:CrcB protein
LQAFLIVFLGAGIGGALRHGVNLLAARLFGTGFPFGTLIVNVTGSFVMGLIIAWLALRGQSSQAIRLLLTTGVLGGYTTFSTFSLDTMLLVGRGQAAWAAAYVIVSVVASIGAVYVGYLLIGRPVP